MKCSVNGNNARTIAKAIQSLAKFGNDLYVEADTDALQLRSFNSSKSAMGTFRFKRIFFDTYQISPKGDNYCKIAMKVCLSVFKNMKQVEHCDIQLLIAQAKLQIQFKCRLETLKNALISIVDEENVTTTVTADNANNRLVGSYKIFNDITNNFNANELEITLEAEQNALKVKNYIEGARVNHRFMRSQLTLSPSEFDVYTLQEPSTAITFCLKEFRAFLAFAESLNENITLQFEQPGDPLFLTIQKNDLLECNLIMSTLYPDDISFDDDLKVSEEVNESNATLNLAHEMAQIATKKRKHTNSSENVKQRSRKRRNSEASSTTTLEATLATLSNDSTLFDFNSKRKLAAPPKPPATTKTSTTTMASMAMPTSSLASLDSLEYCYRNADIINKQATNKNSNLLLALEQDEAAFSSNTSRHQNRHTNNTNANSTNSKADKSICMNEAEELVEAAEEADEFIPQSPQRKQKFLRVFSRCFENTYRPKEPSPNSQIFVPDSDAEDLC